MTRRTVESLNAELLNGSRSRSEAWKTEKTEIERVGWWDDSVYETAVPVNPLSASLGKPSPPRPRNSSNYLVVMLEFVIFHYYCYIVLLVVGS